MTRVIALWVLVAGAIALAPAPAHAATFDTAGCILRATAHCVAQLLPSHPVPDSVQDDDVFYDYVAHDRAECREPAIAICLNLAERKLHFERAPKK